MFVPCTVVTIRHPAGPARPTDAPAPPAPASMTALTATAITANAFISISYLRGSPESVDALLGLILLNPASVSCHVICSRRLRDSQGAGRGVLKKIGIRAGAGEAGGCDTLRSAELARRVRLAGMAVLDGGNAQPGSACVIARRPARRPRQGPAIPAVSSLTPGSRGRAAPPMPFPVRPPERRPICAAPRWAGCAARRQSELYRLTDLRGS